MLDRRGMNLLEMAVALGLVALVLGVVLFRTRGIADQTRIETAKGDLRAIRKAIDKYYQTHIDSSGNHFYPAGSDWMTGDLKGDSTAVLRETRYDPFRAANSQYGFFKYTNPQGKDLYYVVFSYGPDGIQDITGIGSDGKLTGQNDDDIFITNGTGTF